MAKAKKPETAPETPIPERDPSTPGPKPKLVIGPEILSHLRGLGTIHATVEECAAVLRVSLRTLQNFFASHPEAKEAHEEGKLVGLMSLRRTQFRLAEKNANMAVWLGKNLLGQREPVQQIETGKPGDFSNLTDDELDKQLITSAKELGEMDPDLLRSMLKEVRGTKH
jgi:hypothetical protein